MKSFTIRFLLVFILQLQVLAAHASSEAPSCESQFPVKDAVGIIVHWTPYAKDVSTPEVLQDRIVDFATANDGFRVWALNEATLGLSPLKDYKSLADATPLYPVGGQPKFPKNSKGQEIRDPEKMSYEQVLQYILDNYRLPSEHVVEHKAFFSDKEKRAHPALLDAMVRQGYLTKEDLKDPNNLSMKVGRALQKVHTTYEDLLRECKEQGRDTLLPLPKPYVVAGGRFRESYFWDSFWIMQGLIESGYGNTARGMLENFVHSFEKYGIIPNGNRFYYLTRTQVPVFMEMVQLLESHKMLDFERLATKTSTRGRKSLEERILTVAQAYYKNIWRGTDRYVAEFGLFRYSDGAGGAMNYRKVVVRPEASMLEPRSKEKHSQRVYAESGWDMSYSRFGHTPQNWLPVDLNMILMGYTQKLALILDKAGRTQDANYFRQEAKNIEINLNKHLFEKKTGLYMDYNYVERRISTVVTAASFFPFYFEIYPKTDLYRDVQRRLLRRLKPQGHLGLHTTDTAGPGQWDGAWTWAPLVDIAFEGLLRYNMIAEARELAFDNCLMTIVAFYKNNEKFFEKYQSKDGSMELPKGTEIYGVEEGFGWTNAVIQKQLGFLFKMGDIPALEKAIEEKLEEWKRTRK